MGSNQTAFGQIQPFESAFYGTDFSYLYQIFFFGTLFLRFLACLLSLVCGFHVGPWSMKFTKFFAPVQEVQEVRRSEISTISDRGVLPFFFEFFPFKSPFLLGLWFNEVKVGLSYVGS